MEIRPVATTERVEWDALFEAYAEFYQTQTTSSAHDQAWDWIHDSNEKFWCDLVVVDGQICGFTQYQLMHRSLAGEMVCYLSDLYVLPSMRGKGVGKALIEHVFKFARNQGIQNVRWLTQDYNYPARKLYDSFGKKSDFILYTFPV